MKTKSSNDIERDGLWWLCGDGPSLLIEKTEGVDHLIADFPYSPAVYKNSRRTPGVGTYKGGNSNDQAPRDLGHSPLTMELIQRSCEAMALRVQRWILIFSDLEGAHVWREQLSYVGLTYIRTGIWHKNNAQPQITGDRPGQGCEAIVIAHGEATPLEWNGGGHDAFWECGVAPSHPDRHPVEKPLDLLRCLVEQFTKRGDLVADITAGRATTGVACLAAGRKFFGVELDPVYHERGSRRLAQDVAREQFPLAL